MIAGGGIIKYKQEMLKKQMISDAYANALLPKKPLAHFLPHCIIEETKETEMEIDRRNPEDLL
jgi:hypothetical protein